MPRRETSRRYLQLDVFAERPGAGNPLGVMFDASALEVASMQAFAAWTNLSETIFLLPPTTPAADYRVRIFTPRQELPFAGHPSVGAAWAALEGGIANARGDALVQECAAGLLPVRIARDDAGLHVQVRAPRARANPAAAQFGALVDTALAGLPRGVQSPALWDNGPAWWLAELADGAAVRAMAPDLPAIAELSRASGAVGLAVYGRTDSTDHDLVVRAYCPADNIPEDPVTGSANACIAALLSASGALPGGGDATYVASQGRELGRDGKVHVRIDADGEAWIGGRVQCVIDGHVAWPETVGSVA